MPVLTALYENYSQANMAAGEVDKLDLPGVQTSILGGEHLTGEFKATPYSNGGSANTVHDDTSATATGAGMGAVVGGGAGLLAGLGMLAIPGIGPLVAAGWLAATAVGAAGGAVAGGAVGAIVDLGIPEEDAALYSESFRRGGVAVSVRFPEEARTSVESALAMATPANMPDLRDRYQADGWRANETDAERELRLRNNVPPPGLF